MGYQHNLLQGPGHSNFSVQQSRNFIMPHREGTSPLLAASAMPAMGAMPGAYPWTCLVLFQRDITSIFSDKTENQTISSYGHISHSYKNCNPLHPHFHGDYCGRLSELFYANKARAQTDLCKIQNKTL